MFWEHLWSLRISREQHSPHVHLSIPWTEINSQLNRQLKRPKVRPRGPGQRIILWCFVLYPRCGKRKDVHPRPCLKILNQSECIVVSWCSCIVSWDGTTPIHPSQFWTVSAMIVPLLVVPWLLPLMIPAGSTSNLRVPTALAELEKRKELSFWLQKGLRVKQRNRNPVQRADLWLEHDASSTCRTQIGGLKTYRFLSKETWTWCGTWTCKKEYWQEKRRQNLQMIEHGKAEVVDATE